MTGVSIRLTGVTFAAGYPENLHRLSEPAKEAHAAGEPLAAILIRQPGNEADPNAVEVHVPATGGLVGFIPTHLSDLLARSIDDGQPWSAWVIGIAVNDEHPERPGIQVGITPVKIQEHAA